MSLLTDYKEEEKKLYKTFRSAGFYSFLSSLCMLAMPIFMFSVYDGILKSRSIETLIAMFLFSFAILVVYGVYDYVRQILLTKAGLELEAKMAGLILAGELTRQSDASAQTVRDIGAIRQVIASPTFFAIFDLPMVPVFLILISLIHPLLGLLVLMGVLTLAGIGLWGDRSTAQLNKDHMDAMVQSHRALETQVNAQEYIRGQGLYRESVRNWGKLHNRQMNRFLASYDITTRFGSTSKAMRQILQITMIGGGAVLVIYDLATAGAIFATAIIGGRALMPVEQIVNGWRALKGGWETRQRLMSRLAEMDLPEDRTSLPRPRGAIDIERAVHVPRPGMPPIIRGITAKIENGDSIAIVGPSGAGKSTLAKMLVGYLPVNSGKIKLDGQSLHVWDPVARGIHVGYMPQQVTFFDATVRENIARMRVDDPVEWAIEAAQKAGVHELIMSLPQGYDTEIKRGGFMPSGGQSQLIALARAFYANPVVLVLDEPNAALDNNGEQTLHKALKVAHQEGTTVIVVSQRPSILSVVDKVMILTDGMLKNYGPKDQVLDGGGVTTLKSSGAQTLQASKKPAADADKAAQKAPASATKTEPLQKKQN